MRLAPSLLVLGLVLASGCGAPAKNAGTPASGPSVVTADAFSGARPEDTGEIVGRTIDEEFRPLADVSVRLQGTTQATTTTQDGVYFFRGVPARAYTLLFSKPGFEPHNVSVSVSAGERVALETLLRQAPDTSAFVDEGFSFRGRINCSVRANASGTNTNPECGATNPDQDTQRQRYMALLAGVRWVLVEVVWQPSVPASNDKLTLAIRPVQGPSWRQVQGGSPIRAWVTPEDWNEIRAGFERDYPAFGGQIQFYVFPGESVQTGSAALGAAIQQDFTIYATAWYRTDPPEGYTRQPP